MTATVIPFARLPDFNPAAAFDVTAWVDHPVRRATGRSEWQAIITSRKARATAHEAVRARIARGGF